MTLNRPQMRHKAYELFGPEHLGYHSTASARTSTTLTDRTRWGTNVGTWNEDGRGIYIPSLVNPNDYKRIGRIITGVMTLADLAWSDGGTAAIAYENLRKDIHPEEINDCARRALREVYSPTERPLTIWDMPDGSGDGAFDEANTTSWIAGSGTPTIAKSNNIAHNLTGYNSLLVTNTAAADWVTHNVDVPVAPGEQLWLAALIILVQGTSSSLLVYDKTNNAQIGSTLTATGLTAYHMGQTYTVPSTCYAINIRLGLAAADSIGAWDALPSHKLSDRRFPTPDWCNAGWQLTGFGPTSYGQSVSGSAGYVETAASRVDHSWKRGAFGKWKTENMAENSNPRAIRITNPGGLDACDYWFKGVRQESDHDALVDESGTTNAREEMAMAAFIANLGEMLNLKDGAGKWDAVIGKYRSILDTQRSLGTDEDDPPPLARRRLGMGGW